MNRLRVGVIPYGNLFPIFYTLQREFDCSYLEFVEGMPTELNLMLRMGEIDLSPSSSIEYLLHKGLYSYVPGHSVSSTGKVGSVLLFSTVAIEQLDNRDIYVTTQSAVSVELLKVLLEEFYRVKANIIKSMQPQSGQAFLLIGDDALRQAKGSQRDCLIYDLGELWYHHTGLPFVFALWIVRKDIILGNNRQNYDSFIKALDKAKKKALSSLKDLAQYSPLKAFMDSGEILEYWSKLDYELTDSHLEGLRLFETLITKCKGGHT